MRLIDVILPLAIRDTYTYAVPANMPDPVSGMRVLVPLVKKTITGIVLRTYEGNAPEGIQVREMIETLDEQPITLPSQLKLWRWIADYYLCTIGEVMSAALPAKLIDNDYTAQTETYITLSSKYENVELLQPVFDALKRAPKQLELLEIFLEMCGVFDGEIHPVERRTLVEQSGSSTALLRTLIERGILEEKKEVVSRLNTYGLTVENAHELNEAQLQAKIEISAGFAEGKVCLLHGVTSSGKTEVYIHLIREMLAEGKQVLYLVPEIALTTQLTLRLQRIFGNQLGVYHSRFSNMERVEIYNDMLTSTEPKVILAARSGVFLPFRNLGLVIVDEEHDNSFKQQDPAPRYHARSVAIVMAQHAGAHVLLGTATPAIESYYNAQIGKYRLVELNRRYAGMNLPTIQMVDLKMQYHRKEMYEHFADPLVDKINAQLAEGRQVIIFQNRRGYAPHMFCRACGYVPKCCNCDVSLTYHKRMNALVCHYCGYTLNVPQSCPVCGGEMCDQGMGTEKIEDEAARLFPHARIARMDLDTTRTKHGHQRIIEQFARHEVDILIGTQMVTKGLHFDEVSLVAVLNADSMLQMPDFRSYERAYQMLEQVAGRAGRTGRQGEVVIQAFQPDLPVYTYLQNHDYKGLYREQLTERKIFRFPPFYRLVVLNIKHRDFSRLETASRMLQEQLTLIFGNRCSVVLVPPVARVQNMHMRQIRLRIETTALFGQAKMHILRVVNEVLVHPACKGTIVQPDVDPM